ncbi:alginate O-acetyltransferase [Methylosinus sp. H3A]|uniref:alginate O-acetyltransferase AlgX-related protein n=1 Tax=Methylosinus sp. H3A TaxID=2785786 RepID=UPI0018C348A5|nr:alginate O-acetyltransferase [Methylosinus sp. H3A]MBG0810944.1 alginate O-acetyltransferase [Methylosinus sp. H3A]
MRRTLLHRLPIFAAAGGVVFFFLASLWNYAVERDHPKWRLRSAHPLAGVAPPAPTQVSLDGILSGATQKSFSDNLAQSLPVFPFAVRARNQLLYSLFGVSGASGLVVGRDEQLFERFYIDEFCRRGASPSETTLARWAQRVAESEAAAHARGKGFAYLISPSKASQYPQYFPAGAKCPALARGTVDKLGPYRAALDARGLRFVDAPALLEARKKDYDIDFFPRGGTHWNLLGAALATREATRLIGEGAGLGAFDFDWRRGDVAEGTDRDLLDLLNLLWPDPHYPVATILRAPGTEAHCARAPRLLALGGSFVREIIVALAQAPCPPQIDYWFSMRLANDDFDLVRYHTEPGETGNGERRPADLAELRASAQEADAILLEENEANIGTLSQVENLWRALHPAEVAK